MTAAEACAYRAATKGRLFVGALYKIECVDGLYVVIDRQVAKPADVPPFAIAAEAIAWCTANSAKARRR